MASRNAPSPRPARPSAATVTPRGKAVRGRRGRRGLRRWLPSFRMLFGLLLFGIALGLVGFYVAYRMIDIPQPNEFAESQTTIVYFADGESEMGRFAAQDRTLIDGADIPQHVKDAVVAAEDRSFYENRGVSPVGIARALWGNLRGEAVQGGSTITQQYVKNYYLDSDRTYTRKGREAIIAIKIDQQQSKEETLSDYLNTIYFGRGTYGIQAAATAYFDKDAADLTVEEGALLAGIIPNPTRWDPAVDPEKAQDRLDYVLDGMVGMGTLPAAAREPMVLPELPERVEQDTYAGTDGYLLAMVRSELLAGSELTEEQLDTGGLRIVSTISAKAQNAAVAAMNNPEAFPVEGRPETLQAALAAIDPQTGGIVALYGGQDYLTRPANAATQDVAQAGSTFKPFTLVAALESDISLRSRWDGSNEQTFEAYTEPDGTPRPVRNFNDDDNGRMDLLEATQDSVNTVFVGLNEEVGPEKTREVAVRAGLPEDTDGLDDFLSNVLGPASPHPLDMANAYATFAARGERHTPHIVRSVTRAGNEEVLYEGPSEGSRVFAEDVMDDTTFALQQVVEEGSGAYAKQLDRPAAGKTGTSTDNRSAWFVGYTPQVAVAVALYNVEPDGSPSAIPAFGDVEQITGGSYPVRIWTAFMAGALEGAEVLEFAPRADVGKEATRTSTSSSTRTARPSTTTQPPRTTAPRTTASTTVEPTVEPTTVEPTTVEPTTVEPTVEPTTTEPTTTEPTTTEPTTTEPTTTEPTTTEPTTTEPTTTEPTTGSATTTVTIPAPPAPPGDGGGGGGGGGGNG